MKSGVGGMRNCRYRTHMACVLLLGAMILICAGCGAGAPVVFEPPEAADFSDLGWVEAFDSMHEKIAEEYAFTEWRRIDWEGKKAEFRPLVEEAEARGDRRGYYLALRGYLFSIPDGHVALLTGKSFNDDGLGILQEEVGGGFGMTVALLDDGRLIADWVVAGGAADSAGIEAGSEIIGWDGKPVLQALRETSTIWAVLPPATDAGRDYERTRFMVRAPAGEGRDIVFRNPGGEPVAVWLTAVDDRMETLRRTDAFGTGFSGIPSEKAIEGRQLEDGFGYIRIYGLVDKPGQEPTREQFAAMIEEFKAAGVNGLVIDLRANTGGADEVAAGLLGFFYDGKTFYEYQNWYNSVTGEMEIVLGDEETGEIIRDTGLYIDPASVRFTGSVVALINSGCISSGEGVAMGIKNLENGEVVGFRGTHGSFGMVLGPLIEMPGGYRVMYPAGQSLDRERRIQLESDGREGGVTPTVKVPMTFENALRSASGVDVELEYALEKLKRE